MSGFSDDTLREMLSDAKGLAGAIRKESESGMALFGEDCALHIPALIAEIARLTAERDRLRGFVESAATMQPRREWQTIGGQEMRVTCGHCLSVIAAARRVLGDGEQTEKGQTNENA